MEHIIKTETEHKIDVSDWDSAGVWLGISHRWSRMHVTLTHEEAKGLIRALQAVVDGQDKGCPKCGSTDYDTVAWSWSQSVTPFDSYHECQCGHTWSAKEQ